MVSELDWNKSRMWPDHCKNHRKLYDVQSSQCLKSRWIPENNRVVELFDRIPAKQNSHQSAVNNNSFVIFCIILPSIRRIPSESKKCERIIVKYNQNDFAHVSRILFKYEFWLVKIMQLWHFGSNMKNEKIDKTIAKNNQYTMCVRHLNGPQVNILLRIAAKYCTLLYQHLGFPNKMLYWFFERLQYFFGLDLQQFMKEQVNSYFTLLGINIITRGWGYLNSNWRPKTY